MVSWKDLRASLPEAGGPEPCHPLSFHLAGSLHILDYA